MERLLHWILIYQALSSVGAFFVDLERPIIFQDADESFGYQVALMGNRVIVSAALHQETENKTGQLYSCDPETALCDRISSPESADDIKMSFGLFLTAQEKDLLACGPTLQKTCGKNIFVKGRCYLMSEGQPGRPIPRSVPECAVQDLDIVFLVDCSGSIKTRDFTSMLNFVKVVIEASGDTDTRFALVLFSETIAIHFDFSRYSQTKDWTELTRNLRRHGSATHTSTAILRVMQQLFVPQRGARENAEKVLIVITDGKSISDSTPFDVSIGEADRGGVRRFAIGVGSAFEDINAYNELVTIASPQAKDHIFRVSDFSVLQNFQRALQDKIFAIEGTQSASRSSFQLEMSQEGFSGILTSDGPVLGAVGAYDWSGGIFIYMEGQQESAWINATRDRRDMRDSYMGYAVQQIQWDTLAIGAPRHQHLGSVFIYRKNPQTSAWSQAASFTADKIGSYFGSVLSAFHVNSTQSLLVVGAPTYYSPEAPGGLVYLCPVTEVRRSRNSKGTTLRMECPETLQGDPNQSLGHFGSSITILPDLTGDGLPDLAIGAPCEDNHQGAIYIFPGQDESFRTSYVQRVAGWQVSRGIRYFGRSLSGNLDMTGDNLPDVTVGSEGQVLILRSRPVLDVSVQMTFDPSEIPLSFYECSEQRKVESAIQLTVCLFSYQKNLRVTVEDFGQVTYSLLLDPGRVNIRALFSNGGQSLENTVQLSPGGVCVDHSIRLPECVDDSLSPLRASMDFRLVGTPVLSGDSSSSHFTEVSFQKNCGDDGVCRDKLSVEISFTGFTQLVVGLSRDVNVTLSVMNKGDDSYNAHVLIPFPSGLSYRLVALIRSNKKVTISCKTLKDQRVLKCGVNKPLLRPNTVAVFIVSFHVSPTAALGSSLTMTANISSDNRQSLTDQVMASSQLSVRYAVYVTITSLEESSKYQNFSNGDSTIQHIYQVKNLGERPLPLTVAIMVPVRLGETSIWHNWNITSSMPDVSTCTKVGETPGAKNYQEILRGTPILNCSVGWCVRVECEIPNLEIRHSMDFTVTGLVTKDWITQVRRHQTGSDPRTSSQHTPPPAPFCVLTSSSLWSQTGQQKTSLQSSAEVTYDPQKFVHFLDQHERFTRAQVVTTLEIHVKYPIIIGSSAGGLVLLALITAGLYKLGFFKRQYKVMLGAPDGLEAPCREPEDEVDEMSGGQR